MSDDRFERGLALRRQVLGADYVDEYGAVNNGCAIEEIREVLLHAAVYCGVPAAVDAFRVLEQELDALEAGAPATVLARRANASADG